MPKQIIFCWLVGVLGCTTAGAQIPQHLWSGGFGDAQYQEAYAVATDSQDNIIATGNFKGGIDFGGGPLTSAGDYDIYLVKLNANGSLLWSRSFGDALSQRACAVAADADGNIILVGMVQGSIDLGYGPLTSAGGYDFLVAKFNPTGSLLWGGLFGDGEDQSGWSVAVDSQDNVIVGGSIQGAIDFGCGPLTSLDETDICLAKFRSDGVLLWSQVCGGPGDQFLSAIACGAGDDLALVGSCSGSVDFGTGALTSSGGYDIYLARFNAAGANLWARLFGGADHQLGYGVSVGATDCLTIVGGFTGSVDFGGGLLTSAGGLDGYVAQFDPFGQYRWSRIFGDSQDQEADAVTGGEDGAVIVTGNFYGTIDLGAGALSSAGLTDIYLASFDVGGGLLWGQTYGGLGDQFAWSLAADNSERIVLHGDFFGSVDFGGGALVSAGSSDLYLACFDVGDASGAALPEQRTLTLGACPNPFNPLTTVSFTLDRTRAVRLAVFDLAGRHLATLADRIFGPGDHSVAWNGSDAAGRALSSGTYVLRLESEGNLRLLKVLLVR